MTESRVVKGISTRCNNSKHLFVFYPIKFKYHTHCPARAWSQRSCTAPVPYSATHNSSKAPHTDRQLWWWHPRHKTTASTGAARWWRWCRSSRPTPESTPATEDPSWPSSLWKSVSTCSTSLSLHLIWSSLLSRLLVSLWAVFVLLLLLVWLFSSLSCPSKHHPFCLLQLTFVWFSTLSQC